MLSEDDVKRIYAAIEPDLDRLRDEVKRVRVDLGGQIRASQLALGLALDVATEGMPDEGRKAFLLKIIHSLEAPNVPYEGPNAVPTDLGLSFETAGADLARFFRARWGMTGPD